MKPTRSFAWIIFFSLLLSSSVFSQNYSSPLRIPISLSANFGELRNNHFHGGIDYRTQQVENKPIYSIGDGYISRINISPGGYGLALYIDHPTGHTSVYGHMNSFSKKIQDFITEKQYEKETYRIDYSPQPNEITVKQGEQIGLSGNTGGSGGPHLHFEIRDTKTQDPLDVLDFLGKTMTDTRKPDIRGIAFYPQEGKGVVNGSSNPLRLNVGKSKSGTPLGIGTVQAWGVIGVGVKAYDLMNGTSNVFGVKYVRLFVDGSPVFSSSMNRFSFDKTRMLNSFVDFEDWRLRKSFFMKSFVEPGNTLPLYQNLFDGYITINQEKNYIMRYELEDFFGNKTTYSFVVTGKKHPIPEPPNCSNFMAWNISNWFFESDFSLTIPLGNLYSDFCYSHSKTTSTKYFSDIHRVNNKPVPLHRNGQIRIKLRNLNQPDTTRFGIIKIAANGKESWLGGTYKDGGVEVSINELGDRYAIDKDIIPPVITPQAPAQWAAQKRIRIRLSDAKSGISSFKGEINEKFVLFRHDMKSDIYTYVFDDSRLTRGQKQRFTFTATDGAGNTSEYKYEFTY